jgi:hypothetical protein
MAIPTISNLSDPVQQAVWQRALTKATKPPVTPPVPLNFMVTSKQGGNYLTWLAMKQAGNAADGYILEISTNGDFSAGAQTVILKGAENTAYFDTVPTAQGATPQTRYYRVHCTAGTIAQPQSVTGRPTGVISSTAISPNDTTTAPTSNVDTTAPTRTGGSPYRAPRLDGL